MNPLIDRHSQKILQLAVVEAQRLNSEFIGTGQILLALLADSKGPWDGVIDFVGDLETVRCEVGKLVQSAPYSIFGKVPLNLRAKKAIEFALVLRKNDEMVSPLHLLIGILQDEDSVAVRVLNRVGLPVSDVLRDAHSAVAT